jgi:hypothetical protein
MEQKVWVLHNCYNGKYLVYDNIDDLKKALGNLAFEFWIINDGFDDCFNDNFILEEVPLNKVDTEW